MVDVVGDDREFVATDAGDRVPFPDIVRQSRADGLQHLVAHLMAERVVLNRSQAAIPLKLCAVAVDTYLNTNDPATEGPR